MELNDHRSESSQARTPANQSQYPQFRIERTREQILTYLAHSPRQLRQLGADYLGDLSINLGNCLVWISGHMESGPQTYQRPEETPVSIYALGKQLQEIGRELFDRPKTGNLSQRLEALEKMFSKLNERGGAL